MPCNDITRREGMMLLRSANWHGHSIDIYRGKYSRKDERLYGIGNMNFNTFDDAKAFIDNNHK